MTLYLHGLGLGEWLWNFQPVKSYNFVAGMARAGHASVTVDRLGYGASDKPPDGKSVCIGSQADVAHQIVGQLKAGSYTVQGGKARKFKRVGLVGHSAAGQISITEAYTYRDLKALVVVGFSFSNLPRGNDEFGFQRIACDAGGDPVARAAELRASSAAPTRASAARCSAARRRRSRTPRSSCTTRTPVATTTR